MCICCQLHNMAYCCSLEQRGRVNEWEACTMPIQLLKRDVKFYDCLGFTWNKNNCISKDWLKDKIENGIERKREREKENTKKEFKMKRQMQQTNVCNMTERIRSMFTNDGSNQEGERNINCVISINLKMVQEFRYNNYFFPLPFLNFVWNILFRIFIISWVLFFSWNFRCITVFSIVIRSFNNRSERGNLENARYSLAAAQLGNQNCEEKTKKKCHAVNAHNHLQRLLSSGTIHCFPWKTI